MNNMKERQNHQNYHNCKKHPRDHHQNSLIALRIRLIVFHINLLYVTAEGPPHVIPRGVRPWESPGTTVRYAVTFRWVVPGDCRVAMLLAMTKSNGFCFGRFVNRPYNVNLPVILSGAQRSRRIRSTQHRESGSLGALRLLGMTWCYMCSSSHCFMAMRPSSDMGKSAAPSISLFS